jgi:hypothetical protein
VKFAMSWASSPLVTAKSPSTRMPLPQLARVLPLMFARPILAVIEVTVAFCCSTTASARMSSNSNAGPTGSCQLRPSSSTRSALSRGVISSRALLSDSTARWSAPSDPSEMSPLKVGMLKFLTASLTDLS